MFGGGEEKSIGLGKFGKNAQALVFQEEPACAKLCPNITYKQRLYGFMGCFGLGWLFSLMGTFTLFGGPSPENIRVFIALYVIGNIIALASTGFLLGPRKQCAQMLHPTRRYSTAFFISMLIIVFAVAVAKQHVALVLFLLVIEVMAAIWYSASYVPFGRKAILTVCRKYCLCCLPCFQAYDAGKAAGIGQGPTMAQKAEAGFSKLSGPAEGGAEGGAAEGV